MKFFDETWKTSQQQTKFRHGKFNMIHPKSFKMCLVTYKILQNFPAFQLGMTRKFWLIFCSNFTYKLKFQNVLQLKIVTHHQHWSKKIKCHVKKSKFCQVFGYTLKPKMGVLIETNSSNNSCNFLLLFLGALDCRDNSSSAILPLYLWPHVLLVFCPSHKTTSCFEPTRPFPKVSPESLFSCMPNASNFAHLANKLFFIFIISCKHLDKSPCQSLQDISRWWNDREWENFRYFLARPKTFFFNLVLINFSHVRRYLEKKYFWYSKNFYHRKNDH